MKMIEADLEIPRVLKVQAELSAMLARMEETEVVIVGAGPAGLILGLALAQHRVRSIILEKERDITIDPRGVFLTGDAARILWDVGIGDELSRIGHEPADVFFHRGSFSNPPFYSVDLGRDALRQSLPSGILQIQPELGCEVVRYFEERDLPVVAYRVEDGTERRLRGKWLVGADGKKGVVRKRFLEPIADIKQVDGLYQYSGTWVAANLRLTLPTPATHPEFPYWRHGFTPEQVYDLFWPQGWHFCSPPGKPAASGRFGPHSSRLWRHEYRQNDWDDSMNAVEMFWEHLEPMITRVPEKDCRGASTIPVMYPKDCIEILRCRPFNFSHKVVNKWFDGRIILIGDAAHVFPPFGGQGIASGLRDAHQLAWRLALILKLSNSSLSNAHAVLDMWASERRKSIDDAALFTMFNGKLCNEPPPLWLRPMKGVEALMSYLPDSFRTPAPQLVAERRGFQGVPDGLFLEKYGGGARMAQVYVESFDGDFILSDQLLQRTSTIFTILVLGGEYSEEEHEQVSAAIKASKLSSSVLSEKSIIHLLPLRLDTESRQTNNKLSPRTFFLRDNQQRILEANHPTIGDIEEYLFRLGRSTRYAIVRPDIYVFACAKDNTALTSCLLNLKSRVDTDEKSEHEN